MNHYNVIPRRPPLPCPAIAFYTVAPITYTHSRINSLTPPTFGHAPMSSSVDAVTITANESSGPSMVIDGLVNWSTAGSGGGQDVFGRGQSMVVRSSLVCRYV